MYLKKTEVGAMVGSKMYVLHYKKYLTKSLEFIRGGMLGAQCPEKKMPPKVCEFLAVWNFQHSKGATYTLWFSLHPPAGKGVTKGPQESGVQVLCCCLRGQDEPGFAFSGSVNIWCRQTMYIPSLKSTLRLKTANHHLSLQGVVIFLVVESLASVLTAAD